MKNITFINAGAGSGKTYSLTTELVNSIRQGKCQANEVILTTFTDKAANEFKAKAREALIAAGLPEQANLLASAAMGTVHAVALQLLKDYWYHTELGVNLNVLPEEDTDFFINQALADIPTTEELEELSEIANELGFPDDYGGIDEELWKKHLIKIIQIALSFQIDDIEDCKQKSMEEVDRIYPLSDIIIDAELIKEKLQQLKIILPGEKESGKGNIRIQKTDDFLSKKELSLSDLQKIKDLFDDLGVKLSAKVNGLDVVQLQLANLHCTEPVVKRLKQYIGLVFELAKRSIEKYRLYKQEEKLIDFNDMERYFWELLKNKNVEQDIKRRCKLVFVDEFQDSSPIQIQIFSKLSEMAEESFWVGDPKQAIFNFRGTDPILIQEITNEFGKVDERNLKIKNLEYSWRSRPQIVNLTNSIFSEALKSQVANAEHIALKPVRPDNELTNDENHCGLRHWHFEDGERNKKENFNTYLSIQLENFIKTENRNVVDKDRSKYTLKGENLTFKRRLDPQDVAVLRYSNADVAGFAHNLQNRGVKTSAQQNGFISTAEIQLLLASLNYLLDDNDSLAKASILLLTGTLVKTEDIIDNRLEFMESLGERPDESTKNEDESGNNELNEYFRKMKEWGNNNQLITELGKIRDRITMLDVPGVVQTIINQALLTDKVTKWSNPEQRKSNLQTAISLAIKYDQRCIVMNIGASLRGFIEYVNSFDEDELQQSAAKGKDAVNVLTYHKSKGLEWPVVILTDLNKDFLSENSLIFRSFHGVSRENSTGTNIENPFDGQTLILLPWPFGSKKKANRIKDSERFKRIYSQKEDEMKRLLYVGMTRARDYLITTSFKNEDLVWLNSVIGHTNTVQNISNYPVGNQLGDLFEKEQAILLEKRYFNADLENESPSFTPYQVYLKHSIEINNDPKYRSPSIEKSKMDVTVSVIKDFNFRIETGKAIDASEADLGNCLHSIFFHYHPGTNESKFIETTETIISKLGFKGLIPHPEHIYASIKNLFDYMTSQYGVPVAIYQELPLQMAREGYVFRGEADLVWETDKSLILIDYKSYPGKKDHVTNPVSDKFSGRYSGQLSTYKEMLEKAHPGKKQVTDTLIYYAVIGIIVSVKF